MLVRTLSRYFNAHPLTAQRVKIMGLVEKQINNVEELMDIIDYGLSVRTTGSTAANLDSSRSHAIM